MSAATKGIAEYIVNQCEKNPRVAFLVVPLGLVLVYWGISDARYYRTLSDQPTRTMTNVIVESKVNDRGFSVPHVTGETPDGEVSIPVSLKAARKVVDGESLDFIETKEKPATYILRSSLDSQLSGIYFTVAGQPFNFIAVLGSAIMVAACAWGTFAKPKSETESESPPENAAQ